MQFKPCFFSFHRYGSHLSISFLFLLNSAMFNLNHAVAILHRISIAHNDTFLGRLSHQEEAIISRLDFDVKTSNY